MSHPTERCELTNLCMITDAENRILVQDRTDPSWPGICFPGGHVESGESFVASVIREVQEESGLVVIPESIREIGEIVERRRDIFEPDKIYVCHSCFFFCDAAEELAQTHMTASEIAKGFKLEWATPEEILAGNTPFEQTQPWSYRDSRFIRMLPELMHNR